jgi:Cu+-exporting ATPase
VTTPADAVATETAIASDARVELDLSGMHCASCAALIEDVLGELDGVSEAVVDLERATARVTFDAGTLDVATICAEIAAAGYGASPRRDPDGS